MFGFSLNEAEVAVTLGDPLRPETVALAARMATPPDAARLRAMDRMVGALVSGATSRTNIWAKLDVLHVYAARSAADALLNWMGGGNGAAIGGGAPVFVVDRGFFCDGLDDWIDTGFAPSAGTQFQQNSASFGVFCRKSAGNANAPAGLPTTGTAPAVSVSPRNVGTNVPAARLNGTAAVVGIATASGYGLTAVDRNGTALTLYQRGGAVGTATGASTARSTTTIAIGHQNTLYADGQFCALFAGTSLSAAEHADLNAAIGAYLTALGVAEIAPTARTLALASGISLPDGSNAPTAGKGMGTTGLVRRADGRWYVGNGLAGRSDLYWSRMSADFSVLEAEVKVSTLGLSSDYQGSIQGMALDTSDNSLWAVLKLAGAAGNMTYLLHVNTATDQLIGAPVQIAAADTGVAYDPTLDMLWITRDGGSGAAGALVLYNKAGVAQTGPVVTATDTDQAFYVAATGGNFLAGDLLVSAGANGADGTITVYNRLDYGGMVARRIDTLAGCQQIEGPVLAGSTYYLCNDGATHPGARAKNEVLTYAA